MPNASVPLPWPRRDRDNRPNPLGSEGDPQGYNGELASGGHAPSQQQHSVPVPSTAPLLLKYSTGIWSSSPSLPGRAKRALCTKLG